MKIKTYLSVLVLLCFFYGVSLADTPLPLFFTDLYTQHKENIKKLYGPAISKQINKLQGDSAPAGITDSILPIVFYHLLFTSKEAVDCSRGGILQIPYFWHWVQPNPRYSLLYVPDSKPLCETKPPKGFEKYKSFADIDRIPRIYLANLVSDSALFYHPDCGDVFTFGWCSEREMAFSNLMTILGFNTKIKQTGIHVWSEIAVNVGSKGSYLIVAVDNTFNTVDIKKLNVSQSEWKNDFGEGTQVAWYNKKALSNDEIQAVKSISVGTLAENRIKRLVQDWLSRF